MTRPDWQHLCQLTALPNWDLEKGLPISRDLWWTAKLLYGRVITPETEWLLPFVSPSGDGSICFTWVYDQHRLNLGIRDGLWDYSGKDPGIRYRYYDPAGCLPEEAEEQVRKFYRKCLTAKFRKL